MWQRQREYRQQYAQRGQHLPIASFDRQLDTCVASRADQPAGAESRAEHHHVGGGTACIKQAHTPEHRRDPFKLAAHQRTRLFVPGDRDQRGQHHAEMIEQSLRGRGTHERRAVEDREQRHQHEKRQHAGPASSNRSLAKPATFTL
jgi:hypothetical protein